MVYTNWTPYFNVIWGKDIQLEVQGLHAICVRVETVAASVHFHFKR